MKFSLNHIALLVSFLFCQKGMAQDVSINIVGQPDKLIVGQTGYIKVKILNESLSGLTAPPSRLRPEISVSSNVEIVDVTKDDGTPLMFMGTLFKSKSNLILLYNNQLSPGASTTFHVLVKALTVSDATTITSTLGFNSGPQTEGNHSGNDNSTTSIKTILNPLPVTLTEFTAHKEEKNAILNWSTTEEINSERFDVQRSSDAKNWETFQTVAAKGESKSLVTYSTIDTKPFAGETFYRLHMIDKDGTSTYSRIRNVYFDAISNITIYPNPVSENLIIEATDWSKVASVKVIDYTGKFVYNSGLQPKQTINVQSWPSGIYLVHIAATDGSSSSYKILVAK